MEIIIDERRRQVFKNSIKAMADFKNAFGRGLSGEIVAELYAADELGLKVIGLNQFGYDALGPGDERYQVKFRSAQTQNVDLNNFDFDYLVLVNLDENYQLMGMWRITIAQARDIFVERMKFRKYQTTQRRIKDTGDRLQISEATATRRGAPALAIRSTRRKWGDIRGAVQHPLLGEEAQEWVSRSRQEDDVMSRLK